MGDHDSGETLMKLSILFASLVLSMSGCAHVNFYKESVTQEQATADLEQCKFEGVKINAQNPLFYEDVVRACMRAKGYQEAPGSPPPGYQEAVRRPPGDQKPVSEPVKGSPSPESPLIYQNPVIKDGEEAL